MPNREFYKQEGASTVSEILRALAEVHFAPRTRHLSEFEYRILLEAADRLETRAQRSSA
jgi:hypothetical protein